MSAAAEEALARELAGAYLAAKQRVLHAIRHGARAARVVQRTVELVNAAEGRPAAPGFAVRAIMTQVATALTREAAGR